ncbi:transcription factor 12-like isoform X2 [Pocillopora damicornis]|uniref:transcription factor 12-like isoform X2 n=1 Tax=Pocillopora damicornis TaxID=46731 RepID=UPI000F54CB2C|nr:transcription factor 12-like isoform X2 [Pocillopora damicornis]
MNPHAGDKELSDLLDFSAMFSPPGSMVGSKSSGSLTEAGLSSSMHASRTGSLDETPTWQGSSVSAYEARAYHTDSHGVYSTIEDVEGDFISRKGAGFTNSYLDSNSLGTLGYRESGLTGSQAGLPPPLQTSHDVTLSSPDWRGRKYKSSKNNSSLSVYSPGADDMMPHPGDALTQSHYSPKGGIYADAYYMDHGSPDPWGHTGQLGPGSYSGSAGSYSNSYGMHPRDSMSDVRGIPVSALAKGPAIHQPRGYHHLGHGEPMERLSSLPPMTSFRQTGMHHGQSSPYLHSSVSPPLNGSDPMASHSSRAPTSGSQTGDTLGKALASIYPTDNGGSYSSNPTTPVASPPPLASVSDRPLSAGSGASGHSASWGRTNQPTSPPYESHLHSLQSRMEERLDDAIHVLRTHAEGSLPPGMSPVVAGSLLSAAAAASASGVQGVSYSTSVGSSGTSAVPMDQMSGGHSGMEDDPGMASPSNLSSRGAASQMSPSTSETSESRYGSKMDTGGESAKSSKDSSSKQDLKSNGDLAEDRDKRDLIVDDDDDDDKLTEDGGVDDNGRVRVVREQERRYANNARERMRVRDINGAFKELGRMCQLHLESDKPQTKLVILHQAVSVITSLESQVRERNLNPKAACLKRREEEKVEEEAPEKRAVPGVDKPFDTSGAAAGRGRGRRGRRSSRGAFNGEGRGMPCGPLNGYEPTDHGDPPSLNA